MSTTSGSFYIYPSSYSLTPHHQKFILVTHLCSALYPPPLPKRSAVRLDATHNHHLSRANTNLFDPYRMPASVAVSRVCLHPLLLPWPVPRYLLDPEGLACRGALLLICVLASPYLCVSSYTSIFWCLVSLLGGRFCVRARGQGSSISCKLFVPVLAPPILGRTMLMFNEVSIYLCII